MIAIDASRGRVKDWRKQDQAAAEAGVWGPVATRIQTLDAVPRSDRLSMGPAMQSGSWWYVAALAWRYRFALRSAGLPVEGLALPVPMAARTQGVVGWNGERRAFTTRFIGARASMDIVAWARLPGAYLVPGRCAEGDPCGLPVGGGLKWGVGQAKAVYRAALEEGWIFTEQAEAAVEEAAQMGRQLEEDSRAVAGSSGEVAGVDVQALIGVEMRPYQLAGVDYLARVRRGFLADDMGLGKTGQALAAVAALGAFPAIVVTLAVCKPQWAEEVARWLGPMGARAVVWEGRKPGAGWSAKPESECGEPVVHIINYDLVPSRLEELQALGAVAVVCDESQRLKNRKAKRTVAVLALGQRKPVRYCLSGTPVESRPAELLPQLKFLGRLNDVGGFDHFARRFCAARQTRHGLDLSGPEPGTRAWRDWQAVLRAELAPALRGCCLLRREKHEVLRELPPKIVTRVPVRMSEEGRVRYEAAAADVSGWLAERAGTSPAWEATVAHLPVEERERLRGERIAVAVGKLDGMDLLLRLGTLRQVCAEAKQVAALEWLEAALENGRRLVVFAHHRAIVRGVAAHFGEEVAGVIDGQVPAGRRKEQVARFRRDERCRLLALNLTAGGTGLDGLQYAAEDVVFLEEPWTPAGLDQAASRLHRMGQQGNAVHEWHLVVPGTVEDELWARLAAKRETTSAGMGDSERRAMGMDIGRAVARWLGAAPARAAGQKGAKYGS